MTVDNSTEVHEGDDHTECPALCLVHQRLFYRGIVHGDRVTWSLDGDGVLHGDHVTAAVLDSGEVEVQFTDLDYSQQSLVVSAGVMADTLVDLIYTVRGESL